MEIIFTTSLKILFVWAAMQPGMILYPIRWLMDQLLYLLPIKIMLYSRKPLYDCMFCMASVWGFVFTREYWALSWDYFNLLFAIAGLNYIIEFLIDSIKNAGKKEKAGG